MSVVQRNTTVECVQMYVARPSPSQPLKERHNHRATDEDRCRPYGQNEVNIRKSHIHAGTQAHTRTHTRVAVKLFTTRRSICACICHVIPGISYFIKFILLTANE